MLVQESEKILKDYFGYARFRPLQKEIISAILEGKDVLALMPTGGGKSLCYQVPALMFNGLCIVVSPLIALMKNQVAALAQYNIPAAYLNSTQNSEEQEHIENKCFNKEIKLLYISPEKLTSETFLNFLKIIQVSMFAIDEAHCISTWGHDFRPEYSKLSKIKEFFPNKPIVALTATADIITRQDIINQLQLTDYELFTASFDRPNIRLNVTTGFHKTERIIRFLNSRPNQTGLVYCLTRQETEEVTEKLQEAGFEACCYHAGLTSQERSRVQNGFLSDEIRIVCATVAFGMGIHKNNVRFVIHYNMPRNLESYYQEIGRAGRDQEISDVILFYSFKDVIHWRTLIAESKTNHELDNNQLKMAKLARMQQFAEASICRRRILLNYFGEAVAEDCGTCDVCRKPRSRFDATLLAKKALSACIRLKETVQMPVLIDVLRGNKTALVAEKGYDEIKTFGSAANVSYPEWKDYLQQMTNLGIFSIAYDDNFVLKRGTLSAQVLFEDYVVELALPEFDFSQKGDQPRSKSEMLYEELFEKLRILRQELATAHDLPAKEVFNDYTLSELAKGRPTTLSNIEMISGVSPDKAEQFGRAFLKLIREFLIEQYHNGEKVEGALCLITYKFYEQDLSPKDIAKEQNLPVTEIYEHLVQLYELGHEVELLRFISRQELDHILSTVRLKGNEVKPEEIIAHFEGEYDPFKLKIAWAVYQKMQEGE